MKYLLLLLLLLPVTGCKSLDKSEMKSIKLCLEMCREDFYKHKEGKQDSDEIYAARDSAIRANIKMLNNAIGGKDE
jgi:hypothetical protein